VDKKVFVRKFGNILELSGGGNLPISEEAVARLAPKLSFNKKTYLTPYQRRLLNTTSKYQYENIRIFDFDDHKRMCTCAGFLDRITTTLQQNGFQVFYKDVSPVANERTFKPYVERVDNYFTYRPRQKECLQKILNSTSGIINAPTAFGKGTLMTMVAMALPYAKIVVTTRRISVVETLYDRFSKIFPDVGQIGGGSKFMGDRITIVSGDSLHHMDGKADLVLVDEVHEYGADSYAAQLSKFEHSRLFGFSASPTGRFDGSDLRIEALFGKEIFKISYKEAADLGMVVPIVVEWQDVVMDFNPVGDCTHDVQKKRLGIWTNDYRNDLIAEKAKSYGNCQVLILVDTLEHAVNLHSRLPDFTCVYATAEENDLRNYRRKGLIGEDFPVLNKKKRKELKEQYERGKLRHVIATGVWAVGVDFTHLEVLIRCDGGSSEIASIQVPGRVARINKDISKSVGVMVDFRDQFDTGFAAKARMRYGYYRDMEWEQLVGESYAAKE